MVLANGFHVVEELDDVYGNGSTDSILSIKTFYEKQWLARGITIKYISFIPHQNELIEPEVDIEEDTYRSFGRGALTVD
jgi:tRNA (guanine-N7-)-methyltransferase